MDASMQEQQWRTLTGQAQVKIADVSSGTLRRILEALAVSVYSPCFSYTLGGYLSLKKIASGSIVWNMRIGVQTRVLQVATFFGEEKKADLFLIPDESSRTCSWAILGRYNGSAEVHMATDDEIVFMLTKDKSQVLSCLRTWQYKMSEAMTVQNSVLSRLREKKHWLLGILDRIDAHSADDDIPL
jgi:hypothetical protein